MAPDPSRSEEMQEQKLRGNLVTFSALLGCQPAAEQLSELFGCLEQVLQAWNCLETPWLCLGQPPKGGQEAAGRSDQKVSVGVHPKGPA